jgi:hypothetical protein
MQPIAEMVLWFDNTVSVTYIAKLRHNYAMQRPRGLSRYFLTVEEVAEIKRLKGKCKKGDSNLNAMLEEKVSNASTSLGTSKVNTN